MKKGFSLMEMIVVTAILAMTLSIAIPSLFKFYSTAQLKSVSNNFFNDLRLMRSLAIKENRTVFVSLSSGKTWCYGFSSQASCYCNMAASCLYNGVEDVEHYLNDKKISLSTTGLSNNFSFLKDQGFVSSSGTVTFYNDNDSISVVISPLGRLRLCSNTVAGYVPC